MASAIATTTTKRSQIAWSSRPHKQQHHVNGELWTRWNEQTRAARRYTYYNAQNDFELILRTCKTNMQPHCVYALCINIPSNWWMKQRDMRRERKIPEKRQQQKKALRTQWCECECECADEQRACVWVGFLCVRVLSVCVSLMSDPMNFDANDRRRWIFKRVFARTLERLEKSLFGHFQLPCARTWVDSVGVFIYRNSRSQCPYDNRLFRHL